MATPESPERDAFEDATEHLSAQSPPQAAAAPASAREADETAKPAEPATTTPADEPNATPSKPAAPAPTSDSNAGGWFGWGSSFMTDIVATAQEATKVIGSDIAKIGDKVYEALDPDADLQGTTKDNATADATSVSPSNPSPPSSADDGAKAKDILDKNPDHTTTETSGENMMPGGFLIKGIDKTLDFASNALGDALTSGYRKVQEAQVMENANKLVSRVKSNVESNTMVHQSLDIGESVVTRGLGALEFLGKRTIDVLNDALNEEASTIEPELLSPTSAKAAAAKGALQTQHVCVQRQPPRLQLDAAFEDYGVKAHIEALQRLSTECTQKVNTLTTTTTDDASTSSQGGLSKEALETFETIAVAFERDVFNVDTLLDALDVPDEEDDHEDDTKPHSSLATSSGRETLDGYLKLVGVEHATLISNITQLVSTQVPAFRTSLLQAYQKVLENESDAKELDAEKVVRDVYDNYENEATKLFALYTSHATELMLRVSEAALMKIADLKLSDETETDGKAIKDVADDVMARATAIRQVALLLLNEMQIVATHVMKADAKVFLQDIVGPSETLQLATVIPDDETMSEKREKYEELANAQVEAATSHVQDAFSKLLGVCRLLLAEQLRQCS